MNLKKFLKTIKLHEEQISIVIGIIILIVAGVFIIKYVKSSRSQSQTQPQNPVVSQNQTHIVVKGENLWKISQMYYKKGSDWKKIADANNITNPKKLEVGTKLLIPHLTVSTSEIPQQSQSPKPQITETAASTTSEITATTYTVVKGDNLWKISLRSYGSGSKWTQIAKINRLTNPHLIHTGNVLTIPR